MTKDGLSIIKDYVKIAPTQAGVYRMLNAHGKVLYVGKAKNIKQRITAYTQPNRMITRILKMVSETREMVFVTTRTEAEALLLEAQLIKRFDPPFNVMLKDDKSFPYILLRHTHEWPQITKHRGAQKRDGIYYGPFASAGAVNRTLNILQKAFQLRSCTDAVLENRQRPCLLYQIKRCAGPCVDRVTREDYDKLVGDTRAFLEGDSTEIQTQMAAQMQAASDEMDFENAAIYRDRLRALTSIQSNNSIVEDIPQEADVLALARHGSQTAIQVFFFRLGQNWGNRAYFPRHDKSQDEEEVITAFVAQFYENKPVPKEIWLSHDVTEPDVMADALSEKAGRRIALTRPKRGAKLKIVKQAMRNAGEALDRRMADKAGQESQLAGVRDLFDLDDLPKRIEVYDNSHIQGRHAVGAMVVAGQDGFEKRQYRTYNMPPDIVKGGDDFAMMRHMLERRFAKLSDPDAARADGTWPDLLLIDGGKGQLSMVMEACEEMGLTDLEIVAISKGPDRNAGREQFHRPGRDSFTLPLNDPTLFYLQRLRDEAHRFAISGHRQRRSKAQTVSPLDALPGVGPKRKKALLHHFGSAKAVQGAAVDDLVRVEGISAKKAQEIYDFFRQT